MLGNDVTKLQRIRGLGYVLQHSGNVIYASRNRFECGETVVLGGWLIRIGVRRTVSQSPRKYEYDFTMGRALTISEFTKVYAHR